MMKKAISILLIILISLGMFASCANSPVEVYVGEAPSELDTAKIRNKTDEIYISNLFSGLYEYIPDENGMYKITPADADGFPSVKECDDGYFELTVKLKSDLRWSNGEEITPEDYVYSWNRSTVAYFGSDKEYIFRNFAGFENFEDPENNDPKLAAEFDNKARTVKIKVVNAERFLEFSTLPCMFPVSRIALRDSKNWHKDKAFFASNGRFTLKKIDENALTVVKNENFRKANEQYIDKITFIFDSEKAKNAASKGKIDFALTDSGKSGSVGSGITFLAFNAYDPALGAFSEENKIKIRKAIALYAQNSGAFREIPKGIVPTLSVGVSATNPGGGDHGGGAGANPGGINHGMTGADYADYLLEEVAKSSGRFTWSDGIAYEFPILTAICAGREGEEDALEKISDMLADRGITLRIRNYSWNEFLDEREEGMHTFLLNSWTFSSANQAEILYNFKEDSIYNDTGIGMNPDNTWKLDYDELLNIGMDNIESANGFFKTAMSKLETTVLVVPLSENRRNFYKSESLEIDALPNGVIIFK